MLLQHQGRVLILPDTEGIVKSENPSDGFTVLPELRGRHAGGGLEEFVECGK